MLNGNKLRAAWVGKGLNQSDVAKAIEVSNKTFSARMKSFFWKRRNRKNDIIS